MQMLGIDSTSGREQAMGRWLAEHLKTASGRVRCFESEGGNLNVLVSWGTPRLVFCTHYDTVPPYIPPTRLGDRICGRGSCDAKGQIFSMFEACLRLEAAGMSGFGLLLLYGEESGSFGAQEWMRACPEELSSADTVVVGEPTGNAMATASKGTKSFTVTVRGQACHSGYPELGVSAVDIFIDLMNRIKSWELPSDPVLGGTTWNIGRLVSDNPQNILSPELSFRIYFRTTFASDALVQQKMAGLCSERVSVEAHGGDAPMNYFTLPGLPSTTVAFGSDAPRLGCFSARALCGPGSIKYAHTPEEHVLIVELDKAVEQYILIAQTLLGD